MFTRIPRNLKFPIPNPLRQSEKMAFTCYECLNTLGLFKIPHQIPSTKSYSPWFGIHVILKRNCRYKLVPVAKKRYEMARRPIKNITRPVMIEVLKIAIKHTTEYVSMMFFDSVYKPIRDLYMDVLHHTDVYLEELMQQEAVERQQQKAVAKIQSAFRTAIAVPTHPLCRKRLLREFHDMVMV